MKKASKVFITISIVLSIIGIIACVILTVGALNAVQINGEYLSRLYYFEIIGLFIPLIIGFVALNKLKKAKVHTELTTIAIITIIGCSLLGGIFMLCIKDEELKP